MCFFPETKIHQICQLTNMLHAILRALMAFYGKISTNNTITH